MSTEQKERRFTVDDLLKPVEGMPRSLLVAVTRYRDRDDGIVLTCSPRVSEEVYEAWRQEIIGKAMKAQPDVSRRLKVEDCESPRAQTLKTPSC